MRDEFGASARDAEAQLFDEDKLSIAQRIRRLCSGTARAEDPPSRARHFVSNVVVRRTAKADEFEADCYYLFYRSRLKSRRVFVLRPEAIAAPNLRPGRATGMRAFAAAYGWSPRPHNCPRLKPVIRYRCNGGVS